LSSGLPLTAEVLDGVVKDERRHIGFGENELGRRLSAAPKTARGFASSDASSISWFSIPCATPYRIWGCSVVTAGVVSNWKTPASTKSRRSTGSSTASGRRVLILDRALQYGSWPTQFPGGL
jgi:hypothetical protein